MENHADTEARATSSNMERQNRLMVRSAKSDLVEMDDCGTDMMIKRKIVTLFSEVVTATSAPFFCKFV